MTRRSSLCVVDIDTDHSQHIADVQRRCMLCNRFAERLCFAHEESAYRYRSTEVARLGATFASLIATHLGAVAEGVLVSMRANTRFGVQLWSQRIHDRVSSVPEHCDAELWCCDRCFKIVVDVADKAAAV